MKTIDEQEDQRLSLIKDGKDVILKYVQPYYSGECEIAYGVTIIGEYAFSTCEQVTKITIPNSVISIENSAFRDCKELTEVVIPDSITILEDCSFLDCPKLEQITIPDSVTKIGNRVFESCRRLSEITLSKNIQEIGEGAFGDCPSLKTIYTSDIEFEEHLQKYKNERWFKLIKYKGKEKVYVPDVENLTKTKTMNQQEKVRMMMSRINEAKKKRQENHNNQK